MLKSSENVSSVLKHITIEAWHKRYYNKIIAKAGPLAEIFDSFNSFSIPRRPQLCPNMVYVYT